DPSEGRTADVRPMRPAGSVPLPRRKPPTLVTDRGRRVPETGRAHPAPSEDRAADRKAADRKADRPDSPAPGTAPDGAPDPAPDTIGGLPRRIRQASIAPQLREAAERTPGHDPADRADEFGRDADDVRNRMASIQRGWQRGRRQNAEDTAGPGETAPGTTPGGDGR
ncbi:histidine kinase, partial [Streptomyces halstedii]|nr:histidine kinase [Streptomyces halstedii]